MKSNNGAKILFKIITQEKLEETQKTLTYIFKHTNDNWPREVNCKIYPSKALGFKLKLSAPHFQKGKSIWCLNSSIENKTAMTQDFQ